MNSESDDGEEQEGDQKKKSPPAGSSKFGLPSTTVYGNMPKAEPSPDLPEMEQLLDDAVDNQAELLEEFTKVAEELQRILDNLEGSTFVKRLKAASRRQTEVARDLNGTLASTFGRQKVKLTEGQAESTQAVVDREVAEGENLSVIKSDLEAYYQRVRHGKFGTVIREMEDLEVASKMNRLCGLVEGNLHGQAIGHAEFWADTFDRWAEQLVGPGCPNGGAAPPGSKGGSLSPSIVLDVMKVLEKEIGLRDETRGLDQIREDLDSGKFGKRSESMSATQSEILAMTETIVEDIVQLEESKGLSFPTEKKMLNAVATVMMEVEELLSSHETGSKTIAAETEIIERLLEVQRKQPPKKNSKGAGGSQPGSGGEGTTEESALALLGRGDEANAQRVERVTEQSSGAQSTGYPTEFRYGLDQYFSDLENAN